MSRSALIDADELLAAARAQFDQAEDERSLSIGQWADERLLLPRGSGMTAHQSDLTPYWRRIHEVARARVLRQPLPHDPQAHLVEEITVICSAQIGKTYGLVVPTLAWIAAVAPRDVGVILPSHDDTKQFARNKLRKSFEQSPRLAGLFPQGAEALARKVGAKAWLLDQLTLYFLNGAVAQQLRQRDIPILLEDEFDALPANVDGQGSPLLLAQERQKSFPAERFTLRITTPTTIDAHGWRTINHGDHQRLLIACESCGHHQWLDPERIEVTVADASPEAIQIADLAVWRCAKCGRRHRTDDLRRAITRACASPIFGPGGGWMPGTWEQLRDGASVWTPDCSFDLAGRAVSWATPSGLHRSHWLNSLYSSFITIGRYVRADRDSASGSSDDRQTFINNWQANPFSPRTDGLSADAVATSVARGVPGYQHGQCPTPAWRIVLSCDQQGISIENSWFPYIVRAWMDTGESFLIEAGRVDGFDGLDALASKTWPVGGIARKADTITIDTGNGTMLRTIRAWCAQEKLRRYSIAGSGTMGPEYSFNEIRASPKNADKMCGCAVAYYYNANVFRDLLALRVTNHPSVMPWHIPPDAPEFYRDSLTAEERVWQETTIKGRPVRRSIWRPKQWTDERGTVHVRSDNHWWDAEGQNLAITIILGWWKPKRTGPILPATIRR
jgi:phage terminase large subunit GpA-like protein